MENVIFNSTDLFYSLFDTSPLYIWIKDTNNNLIRLNKAAAILEQKPVEELEGRSCYDIYPEDRAKAFWADDLEVITTGLPKLSYYEKHIIPDSDKSRWLQVNKMPIRNDLGIITGVMVYAVDVTDIKDAEEKIRIREEKNQQLLYEKSLAEQKLWHERNLLRTVIENIPAHIYFKDQESRFVLCNQATADFMGVDSPNDIIGKTDFEFFSPERAEAFHKEERELMRKHMSVINSVHKHFKENSDKFLEITKVPLYDSQNQIIGLVGINRDITERKRAEEALLESEAKYRILTEYMTDVVWQLSPDMVYIYLSPSFTQLTGFKTTDFLGKPIWSLLTKESSEYLQDLALKRKSMPLEERKKSLVFEASLFDANKNLIWTEIVSNPVFNDAGELLFFQGMSRDITQRKLAEVALEESQEKLGVIIANAPMVLFQIDKEGIFRFSDGKGLEKLGLKPGQVVGLSVFDVYKDFPNICQQVKDALTGKIVTDIISVFNIYFEILYNPVMNAEGEVASVIGIAFDISERMAAQYALLESENRFKTLFHEMAEGVALHELVFDEEKKPVDYRIVEVNPSYQVHTGIDVKNIRNELASVLYGTAQPPYLEEFSTVAINGTKYKFETYFEPLEKYFKISAVAIGTNRFATVFEDVSVQKKHEKELRDKNDELERFTYTVSHDLKSPLVTIRGFIGMLEQDLKHNHQENIADDIQRIKSATDKMTDLLNDLLTLSRVGRKINPPVKMSMYSIVSEALELLSGPLTENDVKVEVDNELPEVYVDKQRMVEVWLNLIENAVKFSHKHEKPQIKIDFIKEDTKFIFNIRDNGIGIDKKYHSTVFGLFNKLDNKTSGTGIGLALVKRIIEVHGGDIWVDSDGIGKGTKFSFSVPIKMPRKNEN